MFKPELYIFEPDTDRDLTVTMASGPRELGRLLNQTFNVDNADWDQRHVGTVALLIADFTAGERHVITKLTRELRKADLSVVVLL